MEVWVFVILVVLVVLAGIGVVGGIVGSLLVQRGELGRRLARVEAELQALRQRGDAESSGHGEPGDARPAAVTSPDPSPTGARTAAAASGLIGRSSGTGAPLRTGEAATASGEGHEAAVRGHRAPSAGSSAGSGGSAEAPPRRPTRAEPAAPASATGLQRQVAERLRRVNTAAAIGAVVLFFGVAFLLKFAVEQGLFPVELRLMGTALGGLALLGWGWRLRATHTAYALSVQGAGIGILYLTTFAALALYQLLAPTAAFALLVGLTVGAAVMAVAQNAFWLSALAVAGAFLAPILTSSGSGNYVLLFSYYLLINLGIFAIAWFRTWRPLNLIGFAFTFLIGATWGARAYRPELFASVEPFLIAHVLLYTAVAVLFALRQPPRLQGLVDGTLVFGTPLVGLGLQAGMVQTFAYGMAISAAVTGLFYTSLAVVLWRRLGESLRPLAEAFLGVGVAAATLAIPFALSGEWTAAVWALEGAGIAWVSIRQGRLYSLIAGIALQLLAGASFLSTLTVAHQPAIPLVNPLFTGCVLLAVAGGFTARQLGRGQPLSARANPAVSGALLGWATGWWLFGIGLEIAAQVALDWRLNTAAATVTGTAVVLGWLAHKLAWRQAALAAFALMVVVGMFALFALREAVRAPVDAPHPLGELGYLIWPGVLIAHVGLLRALRQELPRPVQGWLYGGGIWLGTFWLTWELGWVMHHAAGPGWGVAAFGVAPTLVLIGLVAGAERLRDRGPLVRDGLDKGGLPVAACVGLWLLGAGLGHPGGAAPLPFVPVFNPLELAVLLALLALLRFESASRDSPWRATIPADGVQVGILLLGFALFSAAIARCVHHWIGVGWDAEAMLASTTLQASWSLGWGVLALVTMRVAHGRGMRRIWTVGAALCALVVVKLFLVDLAGTGTLARIVSFIGVGLLLLAVGYLAPVPPASARAGSEEGAA